MDLAFGKAAALGLLRGAGKGLLGYGPVFRTLAREHAVVSSLMGAVAAGGSETRRRLMPEIACLLLAHVEAAASAVHPRFGEVDGAEEVLRAVERNERELADALRTLGKPGSEREWRVRFGSLMAAFERHVRLEEDRLFPAVRAGITAYEAAQLGARYDAVRDGRAVRIGEG